MWCRRGMLGFAESRLCCLRAKLHSQRSTASLGRKGQLPSGASLPQLLPLVLQGAAGGELN